MADLYQVIRESSAFKARCEKGGIGESNTEILARAWAAELKDAILIRQGHILDLQIVNDSLSRAYSEIDGTGWLDKGKNATYVAEDRAAIEAIADAIQPDVRQNPAVPVNRVSGADLMSRELRKTYTFR